MSLKTSKPLFVLIALAMLGSLTATARAHARSVIILGAVLLATTLVGYAAFANVTVTLPITAVSFPKEVMPVAAGKIEFWAKLSGVSGPISVGGGDPHFFQIACCSTPVVFHAGFNANDGLGNGGLIGQAGSRFATGTGTFGSWTFEDILGAGHVDEWHYYVFQWNEQGIPGVDNGQQKVAIFVDGVLNSGRWFPTDGNFVPLTNGTLNLITTAGPLDGRGEVALDELKIYDGDNNLILWNTLGSPEEIAHSVVGLNGSFNGGGDAHFVPGISGNAVMAMPVGGLGSVPPDCGNGILDPGEECDDGNLRNGDCCSSACHFEAAGTVCRAAAGPCDVAETCSGSSATCPADSLQAAGTLCRAAVGACDVAETCTGTSAFCPANGLQAAGMVCRAAAGPCDVTESCTGTSPYCPPNTFKTSTTVCRAAAGPCDVTESCTGTSATCPAG